MISVQNILLIDDHIVVRKGIEIILKDKLKNITVYDVENYEQAIDVIKGLSIDLVFLDININGIENVKIMQEIKNLQPKIKILVFTSHEEKQYGMRYIKQGADGFLNKFCTEEKIIEAVESILVKGYYYSNELKSKLTDKEDKKNYSINSLSNREYEISKMLINGYGNLEIANKLDIKMSTVSTYKNRVFEKLNINNIVALSDLFKEQ